jgi:hypothetical protein
MQRLTRRDGETLCTSLESAEQLGVQKFLIRKRWSRCSRRSSASCWARSASTCPRLT